MCFFLPQKEGKMGGRRKIEQRYFEITEPPPQAALGSEKTLPSTLRMRNAVRGEARGAQEAQRLGQAQGGGAHA